MTDGRDLSSILGAAPLTAADLRVGDWIAFGPTPPVTQDEIIAFATRYDPLPIHVDPTSPEAERFGGVVASGMQTMSLYASISTPAFTRHLALVAGKGIDRMRLPGPVRPGTSLHGRIEVTGVTVRGARADLAIHSTLHDDYGGLLLDLHSVLVIESGATHRV